jgi:dUTP pyrophosphatase
MKVKVKKLDPNAIIPKYAKAGDAGLDLTAISIISDDPFQITYGTGLAIEIPEDHVGLIFPRSSIRKMELQLSNSVGVIDSGYRGEIQFTFNKICGVPSKKYEIGERVGQLVIIEYPEIELVEYKELSSSERGSGGFGSTGK